MNQHLKVFVLETTKACGIKKTESIQSLWSGYGEIIRLHLIDSELESVVVKWMKSSSNVPHPRGWKSDIGHSRKLKSYEVEKNWYQHFGEKSAARIPKYHGFQKHGKESLLILEDLDASGYPIRLNRTNTIQFKSCISWLAHFHASYMHANPEGLWNTGTYWHLDTRPDELNALKSRALKRAAHAIDDKLKNAVFQTLVHGDAKLANFCFGEYDEAAGVDFQYVGRGCGMKDLAYFVGSCLNEEECESEEDSILDFYFQELKRALNCDVTNIESDWRPLYRVAWADFYRFLKGWSPTHWKINSYSERVTSEVINSLP